jgi:hypothetical protein
MLGTIFDALRGIAMLVDTLVKLWAEKKKRKAHK